MAATKRVIVTEDPIDHVVRTVPPWREPRHTECGLDLTEDRAVISREELYARARKLGRQRTLLAHCLTCVETVQRHQTWEKNPGSVIERELGWNSKTKELFNRELRAIAAMIEEHRDEFDAFVEGLEETSSLDERRRMVRRRDIR